MSSGDIAPTWEETHGLKLSHMRNPRLMGAATPVLDFGHGVLDFTLLYEQVQNRNSNCRGAQEFKFSKKNNKHYLL